MRDVLEELLDEETEEREEEDVQIPALTEGKRRGGLWRKKKETRRTAVQAEEAEQDMQSAEEDENMETVTENALESEETEEEHFRRVRQGRYQTVARNERTVEEVPARERTVFQRVRVEAVDGGATVERQETADDKAKARAARESEWMAQENRLERALTHIQRQRGNAAEQTAEQTRQQVAEHLYQQMQRTHYASQFRGMGSVAVEGTAPSRVTETSARTVETGDIDRAFERDARRYDGGFQWL